MFNIGPKKPLFFGCTGCAFGNPWNAAAVACHSGATGWTWLRSWDQALELKPLQPTWCILAYCAYCMMMHAVILLFSFRHFRSFTDSPFKMCTSALLLFIFHHVGVSPSLWQLLVFFEQGCLIACEPHRPVIGALSIGALETRLFDKLRGCGCWWSLLAVLWCQLHGGPGGPDGSHLGARGLMHDVSGGCGTGGVPNGPAGTRRTRRRQILEAHLDPSWSILIHLDPCCLAILAILAILATERGLPPLSPFRLRGENALLSSRKSPFNTASAGSFAVGRGANLQGIWMDLA